MILGCYTLTLYCDVPGCKHNDSCGKWVPDEFTGESGGECRKAARKAGWQLLLRYGNATCPECCKKNAEGETT